MIESVSAFLVGFVVGGVVVFVLIVGLIGCAIVLGDAMERKEKELEKANDHT